MVAAQKRLAEAGSPKEARGSSERGVAAVAAQKRLAEAGSPKEARGSSERGVAAIAALVVIAVTFAVYAPTLANDFAMDDHYLVVKNEAIRDLSRIPSFYGARFVGAGEPSFERTMNQNYYRPTTVASYAVDYFSWRANPLGFHFTNILIHALSVLLVFVLALRLANDVRIAAASALLFALHPLGSEAVCLVSYRTTLLAAFFFLLAVFFHQRGGRSSLWSVPVCFALALTSKEETATLPVVLALFDLASARWAGWRTAAARYVPLAAILIGYLVLRSKLLDSSALPYFGTAGADVIAPTMLTVYALYIGIVLAPIKLCPFYDWSLVPPVTDPLSLNVILGGLLLVAGITATVVAWRRGHILGWALAWWHVALLPFAQIVPILNVAAERFLYLPFVGLVLAMAIGLRALSGRRLVLALSAMCIVIVALGTRTLLRTFDWKNDLTLQERTAADWPGSFNARFALGQTYRSLGRNAEAVRELRAATQIAPWIRSAEVMLKEAESVSGDNEGHEPSHFP